MSSGWPTRLTGLAWAFHRPELLERPAQPGAAVSSVISVAMKPGAIAFTLTPNPPSSRGQRAGEALYDRPSPRSSWPGRGREGRDAGETEDLPVLLRPRSLLGRLAHREGALRWTAITESQSSLAELEQQVVAGHSGVVDQDVERRRARSATRSTAASHGGAVVATLQPRPTASRRGERRVLGGGEAACSSSRSSTATAAPSSAKRWRCPRRCLVRHR